MTPPPTTSGVLDHHTPDHIDLDELIATSTIRSCNSTSVFVESTHSTTLTIRTWNLHKHIPDDFIRRTLGSGTDVLLMQEVIRAPAQSLQADVSMFLNINERSKGVAIAISSRIYPLVTAVRRANDQSLIAIKLALPLGPTWVCSIYNTGNAIEIGTLLDELALEGNVIAGGDWNSTISLADRNAASRLEQPNTRPGDRWITKALSSGWLEPWRETHPDEKQFTFRYWREGMEGASRLDYFLVTQGITNTICGCSILHNEGGSDHLPVELRLVALLPKCQVASKPRPNKISAKGWKKINETLTSREPGPQTPVWERARTATVLLAQSIAQEDGRTPHVREARTRLNDHVAFNVLHDLASLPVVSLTPPGAYARCHSSS